MKKLKESFILMHVIVIVKRALADNRTWDRRLPKQMLLKTAAAPSIAM